MRNKMRTVVPYDVPDILHLVTISAFIYLLKVAESILTTTISAGLIGSLALGIIAGPEVLDLLPEYVQRTFIILGYIGLLLIVFEAGLSTDITLLYNHVLISNVTAFSGVALPIIFSIALLTYGFGYTLLQSFAAGAALCSTSLGTTLALLRPEFRQTKPGAVLLSAALLDDIIGLIFAAIIPNLPHGANSHGTVRWSTVARPILVSFAFGLATPIAAIFTQRVVLAIPFAWRKRLCTGNVQSFLIVATLAAFVAGAQYAGTSELFGAYLAGAFLDHAFPTRAGISPHEPTVVAPPNLEEDLHTPSSAFAEYFLPLLQHFFAPVFFASIGVALPVRSMFFVDGSRRVIWRGIVYSILMIIGKAAVGLWLLVWPDSDTGFGWCGVKHHPVTSVSAEEVDEDVPSPSPRLRSTTSTCSLSSCRSDGDKHIAIPRLSGAALLGVAMVARGEVALIIAQLARPLLAGDPRATSEAFAVVIWAILVATVVGAVGVGLLLKSWDRQSLGAPLEP
ncbi:putative sodium/hydrogen exchanger family protein [Lyophyllum shimeji]|uniref:Sodium/hydrogen exchanger family protein n=1 Tax=Lyophyllum shimeji TaxID=47721 RepID=A0A9P3PTR0_LYOSH|nr:putative sodium/hydrogen exchanger family protein [Lyophyllum shimeji]